MAKKSKPKLILNISRLIIGFVFIFSGFVKGIDPLGSAYKFSDYFTAFNLEILDQFALPLSFLLSSIEMILGIILVTGILMRFASWATLLFMSFFTVLTLYIAITDPVADCGCFGDALVITNWQTFYKNIFLLLVNIYLVTGRKKFAFKFRNSWYKWLSVFLITIITILIFGYSYLNLPIIDFRPFKIGNNLERKMSIPADAPADEYEIKLYYEKNGEVEGFTVDSLPDASWQWVRTDTRIISKGYQPIISNFFIESANTGFDYTMEILNRSGYTFLLIAYDLNKSSESSSERINELYNWSVRNGFGFYGITASNPETIENFRKRNSMMFEFYLSDEITLKTVIRSNPGLLLLYNGTVIDKWHYRNIPYPEELHHDLLSHSLKKLRFTAEKIISCLLLSLLILTVIIIRKI